MSHRLEYQWVRDAYALQACDTETNAFSPSSSSSLALRFHVGLDDEHIRLDVTYECKVISFEESALFAVLLELARKRLKDAEANSLPEAEQGWVYTADLRYGLKLEEEALNVMICRLRKLFQLRGIANARSIVERRRKQLRIGIKRLAVSTARKTMEVEQ